MKILDFKIKYYKNINNNIYRLTEIIEYLNIVIKHNPFWIDQWLEYLEAYLNDNIEETLYSDNVREMISCLDKIHEKEYKVDIERIKQKIKDFTIETI
jgi:predicted Rossmann-fold nucleotide-binding protein